MQTNSDIFLGYTRVAYSSTESHDFYLRQFHDGKASVDLSGELDPKLFRSYVGICAWTLARAHARSGDRVAAASYLGASDVFDRAMADWSLAYLQRNREDFTRFTDAIASGRLSDKVSSDEVPSESASPASVPAAEAEVPEVSEEPGYLHGHHDSVLRSHRWRTAENSAAYFTPSLESDMVVLDIGCGPGTITADLASFVPEGRVIGIDAEPRGPAERPRRRARGPPSWPLISTTCPCADASVDAVHLHMVLQHVPDPVGALRAVARVLKPGGLIAARDSDYGAMTWSPPSPALDRWLSLYRAGGQRQRRRAGCRALPGWLGRGGRPLPDPLELVELGLRLTRGSALVGRALGRSGRRLEVRRGGRRPPARRAGGARGPRRRLAGVRRGAGGALRDPLRRDPGAALKPEIVELAL